MYNKVELCGMNTAKLPVLTEAEKRELLVRFAVKTTLFWKAGATRLS